MIVSVAAMAKTGRPSKLTNEVMMDLVLSLSAGLSVRKACQLAGIGRSTFKDWMARGRLRPDDRSSGGVLYGEFRRRIDRARVTGPVEAKIRIRKHSQEHWRAAAWFLERSQPADYGRAKRGKILRQRAEKEGSNDQPREIVELRYVDNYEQGQPFVRSFRSETSVPIQPDAPPIVVRPPMSEYYPDTWQTMPNPWFPVNGGEPRPDDFESPTPAQPTSDPEQTPDLPQEPTDNVYLTTSNPQTERKKAVDYTSNDPDRRPDLTAELYVPSRDDREPPVIEREGPIDDRESDRTEREDRSNRDRGPRSGSGSGRQPGGRRPSKRRTKPIPDWTPPRSKPIDQWTEDDLPPPPPPPEGYDPDSAPAQPPAPGLPNQAPWWLSRHVDTPGSNPWANDLDGAISRLAVLIASVVGGFQTMLGCLPLSAETLADQLRIDLLDLRPDLSLAIPSRWDSEQAPTPTTDTPTPISIPPPRPSPRRWWSLLDRLLGPPRARGMAGA